MISGNSTNFDADQRTNKVLCKKLRHSKELLGCLKSCIRSKKLLRRFVRKFDPPFFDLTTNYSYRNRAFRDGTFAKFLRRPMNRWNFLRRGSFFWKWNLILKSLLNMEKLQEMIVKVELFERSSRIFISFCLWEACFFQLHRFNFISFYK